MRRRNKIVFVTLLVLAIIGGLTPKTADASFSCDGPEQAWIDDCDNGDCIMLNLYWSWYGQNCR